MTLEEYAKSLLKRPLGEFIFPALANLSAGSHYGSDNKIEWQGVVIDRQDKFQTELFIINKQIKFIEFHTHPDVDSLEMHLTGDFTFAVGSLAYQSKDELALHKKHLLDVPRNAPHGAIFPNGGAFLSFQEWHKDNLTTVGEDFAVVPGDLAKLTCQRLYGE